MIRLLTKLGFSSIVRLFSKPLNSIKIMRNTTTEEQLSLPMNHHECLEEYQRRVELTWGEIYTHKIHYRPLTGPELHSLCEKYRIKITVVIDLHNELQKKLIGSLALDILQKKIDFTSKKVADLHPNIRKMISDEVNILRRKYRG